MLHVWHFVNGQPSPEYPNPVLAVQVSNQTREQLGGGPKPPEKRCRLHVQDVSRSVSAADAETSSTDHVAETEQYLVDSGGSLLHISQNNHTMAHQAAPLFDHGRHDCLFRDRCHLPACKGLVPMAATFHVPMEFEEESPPHDEDEDADEEEEAGPPASVGHPAVFRVQSSGDRLGFAVNGRRVRLPPAGGATELKLHFHPAGSSSGFVSVRAVPAPPPSDPAPIITGVVSGRAARQVFQAHQESSVNTHKPQQLHPATPKDAARPEVATKRYIPKGPARPFKCALCSSQYKLVTELRGFICLCSPVVAESVNKLKTIRKKKNVKKRLKIKAKMLIKEAAAGKELSAPVRGELAVGNQLALGNRSSSAKESPPPGFLKVNSASSPPPPAVAPPPGRPPAPARLLGSSPQLARAEPERGKLVIMADDFYYGCDPGRGAVSERVDNHGRHAGPFHCLYCTNTLQNNIQLMRHLKTHAAAMLEEDGHVSSTCVCPHCFRRFGSPFRLEQHVEEVHTQRVSSAKCEICEVYLGTEPSFLQHMKYTHKAGEMPYVCQVCDFRSSFYSDVWSHFEEFHGNTNNLMCPYCLKVLRSGFCYMQHFAKHQRKFVLSCKKCRLHFLYVKERQQHSHLHHRTHVTPTQLTGLKPGTKVTVRTYSVVAGAKREAAATPMAMAMVRPPVTACKVVNVEAALPLPRVPQMKTRESLAHLLTNLSSEDAAGRRRCVECLKLVRTLSAHFPSRVRCSLCAFATCCSAAYANHMINDHTSVGNRRRYSRMFQAPARLQEHLICALCSFATRVGDEMAAHLAQELDHVCVTAGAWETEGAHGRPACRSDRRASSLGGGGGGGGGAFVPIGLAPSRRLSVKALASPYGASSPAAMTIKFLRPHPPPAAEPAPPPPPPPPMPQEGHLLAEWEWRMTMWALLRHEQQLAISEDVLLRLGSRVPPSQSGEEAERRRGALLRLCRRLLGPNGPGGGRRLSDKILDAIRDKSATFVLSLCSQIRSARVRPCDVGFMDELSVFVDAELLARRSGRAFQLQRGLAQAPAFDVVLSALSDGTFLPPVLFFRGAPPALPDGFPDNVLLEARPHGFSDAQRLHLWTRKVWRSHVWPSRGKSLLLADVHRGHASREFLALLGAATDAVLIPAGCSCRLQPLDVCVKPVLVTFLQARWKQLAARGGLDGLGLEQLALMLACWLSELASTLAADSHILRRSFASVCHLQKEQTDAEQLIQLLTAKLNMPLDVPKPPPGPGPDPDPDPGAADPDPADPSPATRKVQLVLVLRRDRQQKADPGPADGERTMTS
ncbi:pogo transposable element with ZNF domain isoform X2 [Festucalex cinctus]